MTGPPPRVAGRGQTVSTRLLPTTLTEGSAIGIVAPSSAVAASCPRRFSRGLAHLRALGFVPVVGRTATSRSELGHTSGTPQQRADDLNRMFADPSIEAVMTTIGGTAANHILEYLDLPTISANPKFLIGYSDITVLQAALWQRLRLTTISGPALLPQFGEPSGLHPFTRDAFLRVVAQGDPAGVLPASPVILSGVRRWDIDDDMLREETAVPGPRVVTPGTAEGWLAPVNLESLLALSGTEWALDLEGALLILEAAETTSAARFHQGLYQLRDQGVFERIAGLLLGRFNPRSDCPPQALDLVLDDVLRAASFPVVCDLDYGHTDPMLSLPWGTLAELRAVGGYHLRLSIVEPAGVVRASEGGLNQAREPASTHDARE